MIPHQHLCADSASPSAHLIRVLTPPTSCKNHFLIQTLQARRGREKADIDIIGRSISISNNNVGLVKNGCVNSQYTILTMAVFPLKHHSITRVKIQINVIMELPLPPGITFFARNFWTSSSAILL